MNLKSLNRKRIFTILWIISLSLVALGVFIIIQLIPQFNKAEYLTKNGVVAYADIYCGDRPVKGGEENGSNIDLCKSSIRGRSVIMPLHYTADGEAYIHNGRISPYLGSYDNAKAYVFYDEYDPSDAVTIMDRDHIQTFFVLVTILTVFATISVVTFVSLRYRRTK